MSFRYTTPLNLCDVYKVGHRKMYPKDMTGLQSNWTARGTRIPGVKKVVFLGLQAFLQRILMDEFNECFFNLNVEDAIRRHKKRVENILFQEFNVDHWRALHKLGYLPLRFSALPEGTEVPLRVPCFIVENTHPDFAWLVNYIESVMSAEIWLPSTSATAAVRFRRMLDEWAAKTSDTPEAVDWQGHDFSFRGMPGVDAAAMSGIGHMLGFAGSDTIPAMDFGDYYYGIDAELVRNMGHSVPASEHSVMCAGGKDDELETFERILTEYPGGILSVVSDTWDLWKVITQIITDPRIKPLIMGRKFGPGGPESPGKLVIRPDSGDPVLILCGDPTAPVGSPAFKGVVELLYEGFGGHINKKGYKVLDPHIGTIYGDAITFERADEICRRLERKGFASTNFVLGIGSFTYQYVTRDTFGWAMKATWCKVAGEGRNLFKTPVTDNGLKFSARGRLACLRDEHGELVLVNEATPAQESVSEYRPVWADGHFIRKTTYREIAERVGLRKFLPQ